MRAEHIDVEMCFKITTQVRVSLFDFNFDQNIRFSYKLILNTICLSKHGTRELALAKHNLSVIIGRGWTSCFYRHISKILFKASPSVGNETTQDF
jgi:hypothetical protein